MQQRDRKFYLIVHDLWHLQLIAIANIKVWGRYKLLINLGKMKKNKQILQIILVKKNKDGST